MWHPRCILRHADAGTHPALSPQLTAHAHGAYARLVRHQMQRGASTRVGSVRRVASPAGGEPGEL